MGREKRREKRTVKGSAKTRKGYSGGEDGEEGDIAIMEGVQRNKALERTINRASAVLDK
jgi:hypothetical protein